MRARGITFQKQGELFEFFSLTYENPLSVDTLVISH